MSASLCIMRYSTVSGGDPVSSVPNVDLCSAGPYGDTATNTELDFTSGSVY